MVHDSHSLHCYQLCNPECMPAQYRLLLQIRSVPVLRRRLRGAQVVLLTCHPGYGFSKRVVSARVAACLAVCSTPRAGYRITRVKSMTSKARIQAHLAMAERVAKVRASGSQCS